MDEFRLRIFSCKDVQWLVARHHDLCSGDQGTTADTRLHLAQTLQEFCQSHDPRIERGWIAESPERRFGSIFCVRRADMVAQLQLFLLTPRARARGIGKRLMREAVSFARQAGYREVLMGAPNRKASLSSLYAAFGFEKDEDGPRRWRGGNLIEQNWHVML
jgi:GNAT superfamily N-acetyltransferase